MKKAILFLCVIFYTFCMSGLAQNLQRIEYGKSSVGFRSDVETDFSRPSREQAVMGRMIQVNVWYPAILKSEQVFTIKNYIELEGKEDQKNISKAQNDSTSLHFLNNLIKGGADSLMLVSFFKEQNKTKAFHKATFLKKEYPVVLMMHGSAFQYLLLGQFLASHGIVVIHVPYKGYLQNQFDVNTVGYGDPNQRYRICFVFNN